MISWKLEQWCVHAVYEIKYRPDRMAVYQELRQHLDDRCEAFLAQGMTNDEAIEKTLEAMGDPKELAPQLAAIHRPFWGYVYSIAKGIVIALLIISLIPFGRYCLYAFRTFRDPNQYWDHLMESEFLISCLEPNVSAASDGYTFSVKQVAVLNPSPSEAYRNLFFRIRVTHPAPWSLTPQIEDLIWAQDSLGNVYDCDAESIRTNIHGTSTQTGPLTSVYEMTLTRLPAECEWVDLRYDREGRDLVWRIDLTGGEQP